jgi:hypothetical protein
MIPLDSSVQAQYADGFILDETELNDVSPYNSNENIFRAILNKEPESEHGKMVRFSVFWKNNRRDIIWLDMPESARPIRFRNKYATFSEDGTQTSGTTSVVFGFQYNDKDGKNIQETREFN